MLDETAEQLLKTAQQHCDGRRFHDALPVLREILDGRPGHAEALHLNGVCLAQVGRKAEAEAAFRAVLSLLPEHALALNNLGAMLAGSGRTAEAIEVFTRAAALRPKDAVAQLNLANSYAAAERFDLAIPVYRRSLLINPNFFDASQNLALALKSIGKFEESVSYFNTAAALRPGDPNALDNFGTALREVGRLEEAMNCYRRAVALKPDHASAHWNMSLLHLLRGELEEGWRQYEWRFRMGDAGVHQVQRRHPVLLSKPRWDGSSLAGKRLHVYAEQGYGDTIQFARYLPILAKRAASVTLSCQKILVPLLKNIDGVAQCVHMEEPIPAFDEHCPQMSLPLLTKTTLRTIPADVPYLEADAAKRARWAERLSGDSRRKIGLVWSGRLKPDPRRSVALAALAPWSAMANVRWISLQKEDAARQSRMPPEGMQIDDWTNDLADFSDTAGLIANLDLVISIDTAVAHLAGAMGKPVWVLLPRAANWRWMLDRADSPWYPTMRLFRQEKPNDWTAPIEQVAQALSNS